MISQAPTRTGARVTFTVAANAPVSVVGDFNGWDPAANPLRKGAGGLRSTTIKLAPGAYAFRYLAHGGLFFDDPDADRFDGNEHGGIDGIVVVPESAPAGARTAKKAAKKSVTKKSTAKKTTTKSAAKK